MRKHPQAEEPARRVLQSCSTLRTLTPDTPRLGALVQRLFGAFLQKKGQQKNLIFFFSITIGINLMFLI